jgi:BMFP domain-containing protein YqiC
MSDDTWHGVNSLPIGAEHDDPTLDLAELRRLQGDVAAELERANHSEARTDGEEELLAQVLRRTGRALPAFLDRIKALEARTCPHVVTGDGGISHCALASEIVGKAIAKLDTSHARIEELEAERDKLQDRLAVLVVAVRAGRPDR